MSKEKTPIESKAKEEAVLIYNKHYCSILEYGEELSQEIVISLLANKSALMHVESIIDVLQMYSIESEYWQEVKQELKKML